jgi:hypothetical protein
MSFLLKIAVTPFLVAGVSLAARWWGPTIGGLLMGLPWFTGPVLFVLTFDKGIEFGVGAAIGIELAVLCVGGFILAYGLLSRRWRWPVCLSAAVLTFFATGWLMQLVGVHLLPDGPAAKLPIAAGIGFASLAATYALLPKPTSPPVLQSLPWWDIPMRMVATGALVAAIVTAADVLGPQLSGILGTYPVILTVVTAFTQHRWGRDAVLRVLRGITLSLFSFVAFFLIVGTLLPVVGLVLSYASAVVVAVSMTGCMLVINRVRGAR